MRRTIVGGVAVALAAGATLAGPAIAAGNNDGGTSTTSSSNSTTSTANRATQRGTSATADRRDERGDRGDRERRRGRKHPRPPYQAQQPRATVEQAVVHHGRPVSFSANGFNPNTQIKIWVEGPSGSRVQINGGQNGIIVTTDGNGNISANVTGFKAGQYRIIVSGGSDWDKDIYADAVFTVIGNGPAH